MTASDPVRSAIPGISVQFPTSLRRFTGQETATMVAADTVGEVLAAVSGSFPRLAEQIFVGGAVRRFINVFLNDEDVRLLDGPATRVRSGDVVVILPAVAGG